MRVGDKIGHLRPSLGDSTSMNYPPSPARVIYIHPERRFYVVEFQMERDRTCRECFYFYPKCGPDEAAKS